MPSTNAALESQFVPNKFIAHLLTQRRKQVASETWSFGLAIVTMEKVLAHVAGFTY
jgi:hypothetical protein